jgi:hypothetical protein
MLIEVPYDRSSVLEYAKKWAFKRNPAYLNFETMGGDCTNFASQCIFAGSRVMNYTPVMGWYFSGADNRSASWSGVQFLYNFISKNEGPGPYATTTTKAHIEAGDIAQLGDATGHFYHTPVIVLITPQEIFVAAHTFDAYMRPLSSYQYANIRFLHIQGVRKYQ